MIYFVLSDSSNMYKYVFTHTNELFTGVMSFLLTNLLIFRIKKLP